jgi:hypothetical protein
MILLYNVFITDKSATGGQWENLGVSYDRGNLNSPNKLEILKYSLASYAVAYPWKKVILNLELDPDYISLDKKQELKDFALNEFKDTEIIYSDRRNLLQQDWVNTYELLNDDIIFYQGNHDHIFFNSSKDYLKNFLELLRGLNDMLFYRLLVLNLFQLYFFLLIDFYLIYPFQMP